MSYLTPDLSKDMVLKFKMKHVVKRDVYLDILLMGSIYVHNQIYMFARKHDVRPNKKSLRAPPSLYPQSKPPQNLGVPVKLTISPPSAEAWRSCITLKLQY